MSPASVGFQPFYAPFPGLVPSFVPFRLAITLLPVSVMVVLALWEMERIPLRQLAQL